MKFFLLINVKMQKNRWHFNSHEQEKLLFFFGFSVPKKAGPGCSKLTTSLVNVSLKFQTFISQICQYLLLKKCEKLLSYSQQKISVFLAIKS